MIYAEGTALVLQEPEEPDIGTVVRASTSTGPTFDRKRTANGWVFRDEPSMRAMTWRDLLGALGEVVVVSSPVP